MPIAISCPRCAANLKAPDAAKGKTLSCPKCGSIVIVPASGSAQVKASLASPPPLSSPKQDPDGFSPLAPAETELGIAVTEYITQHLMPGERLMAVTHMHRMIIALPAMAIVIGLLMCAGLFAAQRGFEFICVGCIGMAIIVVGSIALLIRVVQRLTTEFSCTDKRILIKSGLLTTQLREMPLGKVEALSMEQSLFGKLFGYGTLVFKGSGGTRRECSHIEAPFDFYKRVQEQIAAAQEHK
ncbi:MAG TPA: PH domain-containing protein [Gemmataceae bacterium]|nr:PH domain-containing protein [Gemmataceae bacterium]